MPARKSPPPPVAAPPALPPALVALSGTLAAMNDAAVITRDQWHRGCVEILLAN